MDGTYRKSPGRNYQLLDHSGQPDPRYRPGPGRRGGAEIKTARSAVSASSNSALTTEVLGPIRDGSSFRSARWLDNGWLETGLFPAMAVNPHFP